MLRAFIVPLFGLFFICTANLDLSSQTVSLPTASTLEKGTIEPVVSAFFNALAMRDAIAIKGLLASDPESDEYFTGLPEFLAQYDFIEIRKLTIGGCHEGNEPATLKCRVAADLGGRKVGSKDMASLYPSQNRLLKLRHDGTVWRIITHMPAEKDLAFHLIRATSSEEITKLLEANGDLVNINLTAAFTAEGNRISGERSLGRHTEGL